MATKLAGLPVVYSIKPQESETSQSHQLGTVGYTNDGRKFRYAKAGSSALVAGELQQSPAQITNHQNLTPTAASAGATSVTVTLGATAVTANQYNEGYLVVTNTAGNGLYYKIKSHPSAALSTSITIQLEQALKVNITISSHVDLVLNPYSGVLQNKYTSADGGMIGVAMIAVPASEYCWIQTGGVGVVKADADANLTVGVHLVTSSTTAGCVMAGADSTASGIGAIVGTTLTGIASAEFGLATLRIDN